jgi:hypothetical protein
MSGNPPAIAIAIVIMQLYVFPLLRQTSSKQLMRL